MANLLSELVVNGAEEVTKTKLVSTHDLLFAGEVEETTRRRKSLFSNTLVLPGFNLYEASKIDNPKKLAWREHLFDLRGRHLEQAVFDGADLAKADLTGVQLQGASLNGAELQSASLNGAQLQGASLGGARLQGARLDWAALQGASLDSAQLQGAFLEQAKLQGAWLGDAQLQGAALNHADLRGARLWQAELQGASIDSAAVNAADFSDAFLWRTKWGEIAGAKLGAVSLKDATWEPLWLGVGSDLDLFSNPVPWDAKAYADLRDLMMNSVPEGKMRDAALKQIETLDCANPDTTLASCDPDAKPPPEVLDWQKELKAASVDKAAYANALATELQDLVCESDLNAIYILPGIISSGVWHDLPGREASALIGFIMSKDCPVSASLTDDDKARLLQIKQFAEQNPAPSPASNKEQ
jgi:uncharacterized protein YjbI with pentapeptide repeats